MPPLQPCTMLNPSPESGMFSGSQNLTVTGHTFTNVTKNYPPTVPSNFRMVPLGDIDLQYEIRLGDTGIVKRARNWPRIRRVYSAKFEGQSTTVAMYQGDNAEEQWREDIAKYMAVRHPNIFQIRGSSHATSGNIHATLFHDELIPINDVLALHQDSHFSTVNVYASCQADLREVDAYVYSVCRQQT
ncbi:hypothetical protein DFH06DRAFT_1166420 [Mycena polygramma]|nr:hypothetical protein DFH06DRAFT_1166420 [Mycena polygramma]